MISIESGVRIHLNLASYLVLCNLLYHILKLDHVLVKVDGVVAITQLVILKRISIETGVQILLNLESLMQCYVGFFFTADV